MVEITVLADSVLEFREQFLLSLSSTNDTRVTLHPEMKITSIWIIDTSGTEGRSQLDSLYMYVIGSNLSKWYGIWLNVIISFYSPLNGMEWKLCYTVN